MSSQTRALRAIQKIWNRKKEEDHEIGSLRKLAQKLKISPGYLSKIFSGQKPLSEDLARKFIKILAPDALSQKAILQAFEVRQELSKRAVELDLSVFEIAAPDAEWLLGKWYRTTLLDLMTLKDFVSDPKWMARRLGISLGEVETSLSYLEKQGLAIRDESGNWRKKHLLLRFPTEISKKVIREHHKSNLNRAIELLDSRILPRDFSKRLVVGLSVACNPAQLDEVKERLHQQIYQAARELAEGDCTEVYQLNLQLFPQTQGD